ncbi:MAG: Na+/H+ antiporter NhaA [Acidobacteria bacterium]|nr:Na+/H+ antiporter NhaA [Acidobacteriota bacterium]
MLRRFIDNSGLLLAGAGAALLWANLAHDSYERFVHALHFVVNDVAMAFFFALATKEVVEATAPGGALYSPRRASVPMLAAVGGMAGPAGIYIALALAWGLPELLRGWAIPCATDIAFSYLIARLILGTTHPAIPFLLLLAIADDALGLLILAAFYPTGTIRPLEFGLLLAVAMGFAYWLKRGRTRNFWPYIAGAGLVSWVAFYRGGLHPALALVPIVPFLPHAKRDPGLFVEAPHLLHDPLNEFEHWWKLPVQAILFFFGLVNAGVAVTSVGPGTWIVLAAILLGKPLGIMLSTAICVRAGLHKPAGVTWGDLIIVGIVAGIGFTVALFFATAAFPPGDVLDQTKMGALLSFSASLLALIAEYIRSAARPQLQRPRRPRHR